MSVKKALLLNASNMDQFLVYPYALIQVPAVARQAGVDVACQDQLFGFSLLAKELMPYLRPDFGVVGGPDAFLANSEGILAGCLDKVANLVSFQGDRRAGLARSSLM